MPELLSSLLSDAIALAVTIRRRPKDFRVLPPTATMTLN
jgi:hypothetical protein